MTDTASEVCLITGSGQRIGAQIATTLHDAGCNVILHCRASQHKAQELATSMNEKRSDSAHVICADLSDMESIVALAEQSQAKWGYVTTLINNASVFYPTKLTDIDEENWTEMINVNLKAPLFLAQQLSHSLRERKGCIVNLLDIHAERPLKQHSLYCISKAGLTMLTKSLARELAPEVRCNGIAPGAIVWPEGADSKHRKDIINRTALKRAGEASDIAKAVLFLIQDADYITGQVLAVDGGRTLSQ